MLKQAADLAVVLDGHHRAGAPHGVHNGVLVERLKEGRVVDTVNLFGPVRGSQRMAADDVDNRRDDDEARP